MNFFEMVATPTIFISFILILVALIIVCRIVSVLNSENLDMKIKINHLEEKIDNLISGSKRVERITDAINQRTRSYIANTSEKKKQTTKKNNVSSKSKRQPNKIKKGLNKNEQY